MRKLLLLLSMVALTCCSSEDVKPKVLIGDWKYVSGSFKHVCVKGETSYSGPTSCQNISGPMSFHMKFTAKEMTRIDTSNPANTLTVPYTAMGKVIIGTYKSGHKFTLTIKELTDERLSWHQDDIEGDYNYTMDMVFKR